MLLLGVFVILTILLNGFAVLLIVIRESRLKNVIIVYFKLVSSFFWRTA